MYWVKRLLIALGVLVLVLGMGLGAMLLLIDPNDYKDTLEDAVKTRYNRTLAIDGDIRLSVFPRLGLEISGVALSEPGSSQMFAAMDSARVAVAWWPLLSSHLVIEHLAISGVKANIVRDEAGRFNFNDLVRGGDETADAASDTSESDDQPSLRLDIGGVSITGGEVAISDAQNGTTFRLERLSASASGIALAKPFDFSMSGRVLGQNPRADATVQAQGRMMADPAAGSYSVQGLDLRVGGVLPSVKASTFTVRGNGIYSTQTGALDVSSLTVAFQGDVALPTPLAGVDAQIAASRLLVDRENGFLQLEKLAMKAQGKMSGTPFSTALDAPSLHVAEDSAAGEPIQVLFKVEGQQPLDAKLTLAEMSGNAQRVDIGKFELQAAVKQEQRALRLAASGPLAASLRQETLEFPALGLTLGIESPEAPEKALQLRATGLTQADFNKERVAAKLRGDLNGSQFDASLEANDFTAPAVRFQLDAGSINVDHFLPAGAARPAAEPAPASKTNAAAAPKPEPDVLDLAFLKGIDVQGGIRVAELLARGVKLTELAATLKVDEGRAALSGVSARLYEGKLTGGAFADANTNGLGVRAKLTDIAVLPLLQAVSGRDILSGRGNIAVDLQTAGTTSQALRSGLAGDVDLNLRNGQIKGIDVARSLREFKAMLGGGVDARQAADRSLATDFAELSGGLKVKNGVGTVHGLLLTAPLLRVTEGQPAMIDLVKEQLDLVLDVRVVNTSTGQDGKELSQLRDVKIPVHLVGSFDELHYDIQWSQVGSDALKRVLQNEAERQLGRLLERRGETDSGSGKALGEALKGLFGK